MRTIKKIVFMALAMVMTVGATVKAQGVSIQTFSLQPAAKEQAEKLSNFYKLGTVITREDSAGVVNFEMVCCSDGVMKIYFPKETACHCPVLTLYGGNGEWRTDNMPSGYSSGKTLVYSQKETEQQIEDIQKALAYLEK